MKFLTTFLFFGFCFGAFSQEKKYDSLKNQIELLNGQIKILKENIEQNNEQISYLKEQLNNQTGIVSTTFSGVSDQLGASSHFIEVFTIIIGLISVGLGIYISRIERNIRAVARDNETLLLSNIKIKQEIQSLSDKITSDSKGLYNILRKEESNHIVERLLLVPEDIVNLNTLLLSRDIESSQFKKIKEAFLHAEENYKDEYMPLFFQHFAGLSILDDDLQTRILDSLHSLIENSFKNDIIKSSSEYFNAIAQKGINPSKELINKFAEALSKSKYHNYDEIYFAISNQMLTREEKFSLYETITKSDDTKKFRKEFGKILLDYKTENPSPREISIINEVELLNSTP